MPRVRPASDAAARWRRFCRTGWRLAFGFVALWFGALGLLFRAAPAPASRPRPAPVGMSWWRPAPDVGDLDVRAVWTPAAFALATPAGFSHALRKLRPGIEPPVQMDAPAGSPATGPATPEPADPREGFGDRLGKPAESRPVVPVGAGVFPPQPPRRENPRLEFPGGWESRLFSGIDLNYGAWTNVGWRARVELVFDGRGVPVSVLLARASGLPEIDRRLVRSAAGWRLLEPAAARAGAVAWHSPAPEPAGLAEAPAP